MEISLPPTFCMEYNPLVISCSLKMWEKYGNVRYYLNDWNRYLVDSECESYSSRTGKDPFDRKNGIKVYFDIECRLHIDNCEDEQFRQRIGLAVHSWYAQAEDSLRHRYSKTIHIFDLIEPYLTQNTDGTWDLSYGGISLKLYDYDIPFIKRSYSVIYNELTRRYEIDFPEMEIVEIMKRIIREKDPTTRGILPAE